MKFSSRVISLALSLATLGFASAQTLDSQLGEVMDAFYAAGVRTVTFHSPEKMLMMAGTDGCLIYICMQIPSALSIQFNPSLLLQVNFKQADGSTVTFNPGDTIQVDGTSSSPLSTKYFGRTHLHARSHSVLLYIRNCLRPHLLYHGQRRRSPGRHDVRRHDVRP